MHGRPILVVDGDAAVRGVISEVLQDVGYTVAEAEHGQQALALARQQAPGAILVTDRLPDMSGLCLLRLLAEEPAARQIPTVLLTGQYHQLAGQAVADRVVPLPFDIDVLQRQVESVIALAAPTAV